MKCRRCDVSLTEETWFPSSRRIGDYVCIACSLAYRAAYRASKPEQISRQAASYYIREREAFARRSREQYARKKEKRDEM